MTLFNKRFIFIHNNVKSREYLSRRTAVQRAVASIRTSGAKYRVSVENQRGWSTGLVKDFDNAVARAVHLVKKFPERKVRVQTVVADSLITYQVRIFTLFVTPPPAGDTRLCPGCRRFIGYVEEMRKAKKLKGVRYAGGCVCKPLDHGDCAAIDIFADWPSMYKMRDAAIEHADYFDTKYVILGDRINSDPGFNPSLYHGTFHSHLHVSFYGGVPRSAC